AKAFGLWMHSDRNITFSIGLNCATAGDASDVARGIGDFWNENRAQVQQGMNMVAQMQPGPQGQIVTTLLDDLTKTFKTRSEGTVAIASAEMPAATTTQLVRLAEKQMAQPNFNNPPPMFDKFGAPPKDLGKDFGPPKFDGFKPPNLDGFKPPKEANINFGDPRFQGVKAFAPAGKVVLQQTAQLSHKTDPPCEYKPRCGQKVYTCRMTAGKTYQMDVTSMPRWDNFLYFEDDGGKLLYLNDDGGGNLNARLVFRCDRTADYRIIVTALHESHQGQFTLMVREQ